MWLNGFGRKIVARPLQDPAVLVDNELALEGVCARLWPAGEVVAQHGSPCGPLLKQEACCRDLDSQEALSQIGHLLTLMRDQAGRGNGGKALCIIDVVV